MDHTRDEFVTEYGEHLLQSSRWGQLKGDFGWIPLQIRRDGAIAQVLFKRLPLRFTIAYIPKGPLMNWSAPNHALLEAIHAEARQRRAVFLKIEPDAAAQNPAPAQFLAGLGFSPADTIQPQTTLVIDLSGDEESILAAMKQKTRYNIRLAAKKGVVIRRGTAADVPLFHQLSRVTAGRDGFGIHPLKYYQRAFELFAPENCALLLAEYQNEPLAGLMVFTHNANAYYFYGASSDQQRNLMPTYLLQWETMRWAKSRGCTRYDLWGIPNATPAMLEAEFNNRSDGLWGVYRFKRGFGGQVEYSAGAFDYVYNPLLYRLYRLRRSL